MLCTNHCRVKARKAKLLKWEFLLGPRIFCSGSMLELIFLLMIEINVCIVTKYGTFKCISSCGKRLKSENDVQVCSLFFFSLFFFSPEFIHQVFLRPRFSLLWLERKRLIEEKTPNKFFSYWIFSNTCGENTIAFVLIRHLNCS